MWSRIKVTEEQAQNWKDFREAEGILPTNSSIPVWHAVDIIRSRRQRKSYNQIVEEFGYSYNSVKNVSKWAGLGGKAECISL